MILARTPEDETPLQLQHVWFAQSLGAEHHRHFAELAGVAPRQLYGMTETVAIVTADRSDPPSHDLIGPAIQGRTVRVVDGEGEVLDRPGDVGELQVRGRRGFKLFLEYLDAPEINARVFQDTGFASWFATGDLVELQEDGAFRYVGRIDDVIKVAGENVSLTEVEAAIAQAPGVLEAAVLPQDDPIRDKVPVAYVVAKDPEHPPTADALEAWAATQLAPAARPRAWHLIDALPRTSVGKVRRFRITTGEHR